MAKSIEWLRKNKFRSHFIAFLMMIIPPIGMYIFARNNFTPFIWVLLGVVVLGNFIALVTK